MSSQVAPTSVDTHSLHVNARTTIPYSAILRLSCGAKRGGQESCGHTAASLKRTKDKV